MEISRPLQCVRRNESAITSIHFVDSDKEDILRNTTRNSTISFEEFAIEGYKMIVLNDEARPITQLYCDRDIKVNIMYIPS